MDKLQASIEQSYQRMKQAGLIQVAPTFRRMIMCRSIHTLRRQEGFATDEEIHQAALQFVRKITGFRRSSRANQEMFDAAVAEVAVASRKLLHNLVISP